MPKDITEAITESAIQMAFHDLAAQNYPRMVKAMANMTEEEIKVHPVYKAFYYTATKAGRNWKSFLRILVGMSPEQIREALKLVNTFEKVAQKGGLKAEDKVFLENYQKNLFQDFEKLNNMKLSDKEHEEIARQYKKENPELLMEDSDKEHEEIARQYKKENPELLMEDNDLQVRLDVVYLKIMSALMKEHEEIARQYKKENPELLMEDNDLQATSIDGRSTSGHTLEVEKQWNATMKDMVYAAGAAGGIDVTAPCTH
ncbi:uncharacterized protein LOC103511340 [Diaphorina citri]|uniref:Uncharacterized protein LOC103511340 n=1 Tax=Diaphorina citri TaxID=121845 RepID=A0A3Q0IXG2_DIACI|nr:uncharacterized protein LOC103511340 [Diaphorina citri]